jgi:hypothetical protein
LEYIEIAYIHVEMTEQAHFKRVAETIHRIPYPVVLMLTQGDALCLSTAPKRINQADPSKLTTEEYFYTDWIDLSAPTEAQEAFWGSMQLGQLSFENFHTFYQDICERIVALEAAQLSGAYSTEDIAQKKQILDKIHPLQEQVRALKSRITKESQFNAKVRLNMQIKSMEEEINVLIPNPS